MKMSSPFADADDRCPMITHLGDIDDLQLIQVSNDRSQGMHMSQRTLALMLAIKMIDPRF